MRLSATRLARSACVALIALLSLTLLPAAARAANCNAGTLVTVVAHLDDDLLFIDPAISERLDAGWCITTVHLIGGANGANFSYVLTREQASRLAYARMAGVPDVWDESNVEVAGKLVHQMVLKAKPQVRLLELRLPGGGVRGGREPLSLLWEQRATLSTYPMNTDGSARMKYDRGALSATLKSILSEASQIYTLNPDTVPFIEHPDHIFAARITRHVAQTLHKSVPIVYHVTYPTGGWPGNLPAAEVQRKRDIVASYFSIDGSESSHVFGEFQWDGNWIARRYAFADRSDRRAPDFEARPVKLFNVATNRCVSANGIGEAPTLAACNGSPAQQWRWEPVTAYPGNARNAALVSVATSQCIAERDGFLRAESCDQWDIAQRWTPWDFGLVYTPMRHCLGENRGKLTMRGCTSLTTRYRWATTQRAQANDLRLATAMYGDVTGTGTTSAVYVQRQHDGPGFGVYAASLEKKQAPALWYSASVPFNPRATTPSCAGDTLCFDSARFLLGDFDGDGKADLMVVTARENGTAFWLLRSAGDRFEAPRLWLQTSPAFKPELTQQYVVADFTGTNRASVLIAQKRADRGLDLWIASSNGVTGAAPTRAAEATGLAQNTMLLPFGKAGSRSSLIALETVQQRVSVRVIANDAGRMTIGERRMLPADFAPGFVKAAIAAAHGEHPDSLMLLTPRLAGTDAGARIDIASLDIANPTAVPVQVASLQGMPWSDVFPAYVQDKHGAALVVFRRMDATLGDFYFTGGAPALSRYPLTGNLAVGTPLDLGEMPGLFSETVRIDRLTQ